MRITIFNRDNNLDYRDEYSKMLKILNGKCLEYNKKEYTYFDFINIHLFNNWKYRSTYLDCYEYLESIGVNIKSKKISKENFINFMEFILNIQLLISNLKYYSDNIKFSIKAKSIITHNIPLILESYNYQAYSLDDKIIICEKDIDYEDIESIVPDDIYSLLISYKNINNNGIKMKRIILNKIYDYLILDIDKYKGYSTSIFNSIKFVITKLGVSSTIDKKYSSLSNYKLRKCYDGCFGMMLYLIKTELILKEKEEIKTIIN